MLRQRIENIRENTYHIIGDSAFSSYKNILITRSTQSQPLTPREIYYLSRQRIKVENAFGFLKGKFQ